MPRISVVLPIYNAERYLSEAIHSVLSQTFDDFEMFLLNDGSSDGSAEIVREAAARDSRVVVVNGDHSGLVHWLNVGVDMAKGELIARMDADDICSHDRFAYQTRFLDARPECCAVGTRAVRIDPDGLPIDLWWVPEQHEDIDGWNMAGRTGAMIHPSVMIRKTALYQVGGYRSTLESAEDYDLFLRLAEVGQLANLPQSLLRYRVHPKSVTLTRAEVQTRLTRQALREAWTRRKKAGPLPISRHDPRTLSEEELIWSWAQAAFCGRNFRTARKHAFRVLWRRPSEFRRWVLFGAACLGPLAKQMMRICPYRIGPYLRTTTAH
jgi:glycosyltransferase involved in cell wall biosynthesis